MEETKFLTTTKVAEQLGVSLRRVQALIKDGRLPSMQIGREHLIKQSDVKLVQIRMGGRMPKKWKGLTPYVMHYIGSQYRVEFVGGLQQARGINESPKRYEPISVIVDIGGDEPKYFWKPEAVFGGISREEFQERAFKAVEVYLGFQDEE